MTRLRPLRSLVGVGCAAAALGTLADLLFEVGVLPSACGVVAASCLALAWRVCRQARRQAVLLHDSVRDLEVGAGTSVGPRRERACDEPILDLVDRLRRVAQRHARRVHALEGQVLTLERQHDETLATVRGRNAFMANLSHEIRTPLNGLLGFLGMLNDSVLDAQQREWATVARESGEALLALLNDVLDLAKIEAGKLALERVDFDRDELFENVAALFAPAAHAQGVELLLDIDPDLPLRLAGDPMRLRQIVANLVSNAVKFTKDGEVELSARLAERAGTRIVMEIEVRDSGVGIAAERLDRLFHAFEQAEDSTARRFGGTGLGLAIVKRITEQMAGGVTVDSQVGRGTRFVVRVPLSVASSSPPPPPRQPVGVLLIDGFAHRRDLLARQLRAQFQEVVAVADGGAARAALPQLAEHPRPLSVLVDDAVRLDDETRTALRRRIGTRVIALRPPSAAYAAIEEGVDAVLVRPVRRAALAAAISGAVTDDGTPEQPPHEGAGRRILLVEDNAVNQRLMCAMLARLGAHVLVASDGSEGVAAFQRHGSDLVLMDVQMPVMDGMAATRAIRASSEAGACVPILALTANAQTGDREACLAAGMTDYLTKPVRAPALREALARWLPASQTAADRGAAAAVTAATQEAELTAPRPAAAARRRRAR